MEWQTPPKMWKFLGVSNNFFWGIHERKRSSSNFFSFVHIISFFVHFTLDFLCKSVDDLDLGAPRVVLDDFCDFQTFCVPQTFFLENTK